MKAVLAKSVRQRYAIAYTISIYMVRFHASIFFLCPSRTKVSTRISFCSTRVMREVREQTEVRSRTCTSCVALILYIYTYEYVCSRSRMPPSRFIIVVRVIAYMYCICVRAYMYICCEILSNCPSPSRNLTIGRMYTVVSYTERSESTRQRKM